MGGEQAGLLEAAFIDEGRHPLPGGELAGLALFVLTRGPAAQKGLLSALLEPTDLLRELEAKGDGASKLALLEELKTYPVGAVWNMFCHQHQSPAGTAWINAMTDYDRTVIRAR